MQKHNALHINARDGRDRIAELEAEVQALRGAVPAGYVLVPKSLIDDFPEINPSNYGHDDACALNSWGCEVVTNAIAAAPQRSLWAIHVPGPDDYYPAPSEEAAKHMATKHNAAMAEYYKANPDTSGYRPPIESAMATAALWTGSAADHAEEIAAFDYAAWGLAAPQPAAQPTDCRHCGGLDTVLCGGQCKPTAQQELDRMAQYVSTITQSEIDEADSARGIPTTAAQPTYGSPDLERLILDRLGQKAQPAAQQDPAGEPVGVVVATRWNADGVTTRYEAAFRPSAAIKAGDLLYTRPAVPLTDEFLLSLWSGSDSPRPVLGKNKVLAFARAIEAAHKIGGAE
jgi:hypothetical protein